MLLSRKEGQSVNIEMSLWHHNHLDDQDGPLWTVVVVDNTAARVLGRFKSFASLEKWAVDWLNQPVETIEEMEE